MRLDRIGIWIGLKKQGVSAKMRLRKPHILLCGQWFSCFCKRYFVLPTFLPATPCFFRPIQKFCPKPAIRKAEDIKILVVKAYLVVNHRGQKRVISTGPLQKSWKSWFFALRSDHFPY